MTDDRDFDRIARAWLELGPDEAPDRVVAAVREGDDRRSPPELRQSLAEAEADYLQAIALSPPYHEVYTNLGQCYRRMGRWDDAVARGAPALVTTAMPDSRSRSACRQRPRRRT